MTTSALNHPPCSERITRAVRLALSLCVLALIAGEAGARESVLLNTSRSHYGTPGRSKRPSRAWRRVAPER